MMTMVMRVVYWLWSFEWSLKHLKSSSSHHLYLHLYHLCGSILTTPEPVRGIFTEGYKTARNKTTTESEFGQWCASRNYYITVVVLCK